ncbi:DUF599 domain-containing protein [Thauera sinica]|uniref:DUF599 domain-containing protein n=1 Tax=Thauera sinica TaxID=2665146 RepID=A0ABW1AQ32_9RHOO|nr:DUF599 domain-containing protein [Thauera sp. K11]ATE59601.1 hypothetical protein CCZ27_06265 [Thauera sp. K11]
MPSGLFSVVSYADAMALAWFLVVWIGYGWLSEHSPWARHGLADVGDRHRLAWGWQMLRREVRIPDAALVGNLMQSVSFYANTTIYIIAGVLALLGTLDQVISFTEDLPFARETSRALWEMKLALLFCVFVFAYFKFTWALRQFNLLSILIGSTPVMKEENESYDPRLAEIAARRLGRVNSLAGDEFNRGIRAYYFGLAAVAWFVQPWIFMAMTTVIAVVLYRRDFTSALLIALRDE